jgi:hypothetical protein
MNEVGDNFDQGCYESLNIHYQVKLYTDVFI